MLSVLQGRLTDLGENTLRFFLNVLDNIEQDFIESAKESHNKIESEPAIEGKKNVEGTKSYRDFNDYIETAELFFKFKAQIFAGTSSLVYNESVGLRYLSLLDQMSGPIKMYMNTPRINPERIQFDTYFLNGMEKLGKKIRDGINQEFDQHEQEALVEGFFNWKLSITEPDQVSKYGVPTPREIDCLLALMYANLS